ncbi:MAG: hypothetical protein ACLU3U_09465 [Gallintestinimicrobium sp.]
MRTLSEIIVKKDYTAKQKPRPFLDQNNPVIQKGLRLCFIFLLTAAGLGEWKTLNTMLGGLPKAITAGIICMTIAYAIIFPDLKRFKQLKGPTLFYMSLITALLLWSMVIWILNFMNLSSMIRGCSKVIFQSIAILTACFRCVFVWCQKQWICLQSPCAWQTVRSWYWRFHPLVLQRAYSP